jgi:plasmid maintenance system killer protein
VSRRAVHWAREMIVAFRDAWLRAFFVKDLRSRRIPSDLEGRLFRKLQMIDDATTDQDLRYRRATISNGCAGTWQAIIRSA